MKLFDKVESHDAYSSLNLFLIDKNGNRCNAYINANQYNKTYYLDLHIYNKTCNIPNNKSTISVEEFNILVSNVNLISITVFYTRVDGDILIVEENCIIKKIDHVHHR